jgi:hypothetical protein
MIYFWTRGNPMEARPCRAHVGLGDQISTCRALFDRAGQRDLQKRGRTMRAVTAWSIALFLGLLLALPMGSARADPAGGTMNLPKWWTATGGLEPIVKHRVVPCRVDLRIVDIGVAGPGTLVRCRLLAKRDGFDPDLWFDNVENEIAKTVGAETVFGNIYKYYVGYSLLLDRRSAEAAARQKFNADTR